MLLAAVPVGLAPDGSILLALCGALAMSAVLACFTFPLRGRVLLWLALALSRPAARALARARAAAGRARRLARSSRSWSGGASTTTCAPAPRGSNGLRFWRLVLTNSDPTSGNALEQVPKMLMSLSAATLLAEEPGAGSVAAIAAAAALAALLGALAARRFARTRMPRYPSADAERSDRPRRSPAAST